MATSRPVPQLSQEAIEVLMRHDWPGNVRELENAVERALVVGRGNEIRPADFSFQFQMDEPKGGKTLDDIERVHIESILRETQHNLSRGCADRGFAHLLAQVGREERRRGLLDELLVAALDRAVPFAKVDHFPVAVRQDLELDVPGPLDVPLQVHPPVAERLFRLVPGDVVFLGERNVVVGDPHAAPAPAGDRLDDYGIADLARDLDLLALGLDGPVAARHGIHVRLPDGFPCNRLVSHQLDGFGLRTYELDVTGLALLGEFRVLRQEAVPWMDGVDIGDLGRAYDPVGPQVAVRAAGAADAYRLVGELHVERLDIRLGIDRERLDAELAACADDSQGDFTAVGDEDFLDHRVDV